MAVRMNMLKLLQEVRGFAQFPTRPDEPRPANSLLLQFRSSSRRKSSKLKRLLKIEEQERIDIPKSVPITHLGPQP